MAALSNLIEQVANGRIVDERRRAPLEAFLDVVLLLLFERDLVDVLVQLFVAVIDDELLEAVRWQVLEAVHVEDGEDAPLAVHLRLITLQHGI